MGTTTGMDAVRTDALGDVTVAQARVMLERRLRAAGIESAAVEATMLLAYVTGLDRTQLLVEPARPLGRRERVRLVASLERRTKREPLQHILGKAPFYGLELAVGPDVLVPRPETESLVELVLAGLEGADEARVLDVGTGSGAIALAIKHERPATTVMATDVSAAALAVARANATALGLPIALERSDLLAAQPVAAFAAVADVVVANLPYLPEADETELPPEVRADPPLALFAGSDGLALVRRLELQARQFLKAGAVLALELDPRNVDKGMELFKVWKTVRSARDLTERERFVLAHR